MGGLDLVADKEAGAGHDAALLGHQGDPIDAIRQERPEASLVVLDRPVRSLEECVAAKPRNGRDLFLPQRPDRHPGILRRQGHAPIS